LANSNLFVPQRCQPEEVMPDQESPRH